MRAIVQSRFVFFFTPLGACAFTQAAGSSALEETSVQAPARDQLAAATEGYAEFPKKSASLGYNSVNTTEKAVAMTFDDGPHATNTPRLLDMLKQRNAKATFFIVGQCAQEYPAIMKRIVDEGHEIANHSWSHPAFAKMSESAVRSQIDRTQDIIRQTTGVTATLLRPPYGSIASSQRNWITNDMGLKIIMWSVDPLDWKNRNASMVQSRIVSQAAPGAIILAHDIHKTTVDAMPETLNALAAKGYKLVTVSELLAMDQPKAKPTPKPDPNALPVIKAEPVAAPAAN